MLFVLQLSHGERFKMRMDRQIRTTQPGVDERVRSPRHSNGALVGHTHPNLLLQPRDEAVEQRIAAYDEDIGQEARPQTMRQTLQRL